MGTAKWWVCDACKSLNDLPANKCYNCRGDKPDAPTLIDDQYSKVGGGENRVGVSVDMSKVGDLTRPDPIETAAGGALMEAFEKVDDPYADLDRKQQAGQAQSGAPRYDPYAGGYETPARPPEPQPTVRPMREPTRVRKRLSPSSVAQPISMSFSGATADCTMATVRAASGARARSPGRSPAGATQARLATGRAPRRCRHRSVPRFRCGSARPP